MVNAVENSGSNLEEPLFSSLINIPLELSQINFLSTQKWDIISVSDRCIFHSGKDSKNKYLKNS